VGERLGAGLVLDTADAVFAAVLAVAVGAGDAVVVALAVGVDVSVTVALAVGVEVAVGVSVGVGVGVGVARMKSIGSRTHMRVAVWPERAAVMSPVWTNLLFAGS
jgi:hypothetical protein